MTSWPGSARPSVRAQSGGVPHECRRSLRSRSVCHRPGAGVSDRARRAARWMQADALDVVYLSAAARARPFADSDLLRYSLARRSARLSRASAAGAEARPLHERGSRGGGTNAARDFRLARRHEVSLVDDAVRRCRGRPGEPVQRCSRSLVAGGRRPADAAAACRAGRVKRRRQESARGFSAFSKRNIAQVFASRRGAAETARDRSGCCG